MFVGAGAVGSAAALETARAGYATVYLYDIETERARGKAMDICQALDHPYLLEHCADMGKASEADLVVVTAGMARQKGMTRADLAAGNIGIVSGIAADVASIAPAVPVIVVTNPSEALVYLIRRRWPALLRVFGFGCSLDQWRYRRFVAQALGCNAERVSAIVMGMHSDSMIPLSRLASVDGIPLNSLLEHGAISAIESRTRTAGTDIVNALGDHSGFVAAGRAIASFIGSLVNGNGGIYPVSIMTEGAYGIADACLALPSRVSPSGIVPMELELTDAELSRLTSCAERVLETARAHESATARR
jgi:malate dehydrogenase